MVEVKNNVFLSYSGSDAVYRISEYAEEPQEMITEIAPKAFLSCKSIKKLFIPRTVSRIGDWAFAHMKGLEELVLPFRELTCGKKLFLDCGQLKRIRIEGGTADCRGIPYFLASAVTVLEAEYLLQPDRAGDIRFQEKWVEDYDRALETFLKSSDEEGFEPVFMGWFTVEDTDVQIPRYVEKRRIDKICLILQRLLYSEYLTEDRKAFLFEYLTAYLPGGSGKHTLTMEVICDKEREYHNNVRYFEILQEGGCLKRKTMNELLRRSECLSPEVVSFLLGKRMENYDCELFEMLL